MAYRLVSLVKHKPKKKQKVLRKLLDAKAITEVSEEINTLKAVVNTTEDVLGTLFGPGIDIKDSVVGYWKPTLDLSLVVDMQSFPRNHVPAQIAKVCII